MAARHSDQPTGKRRVMISLGQKLWRQRRAVKGFKSLPRGMTGRWVADTLGVKLAAINGWEDLDGLTLPICQAGGSVRCPGSASQDVAFSWRVTGRHPFLRRGEVYRGVGSTALEAAIMGLFLVAELIYYRSKRHAPGSPWTLYRGRWT